ncbi:MAG: NUDIX domain-containing protein [Rikenellaceae bacterium]
MINQSAEELFPIVDAEGAVVGSATRAQCHGGSMLLHPVVHLHLFNSAGELFLQHRPAWKDIQPNRWDSGVGGHVDYGESVEQALLRESREELSVESFTPQFVCSYIFESERERELVNVFTTCFDGDVRPTEECDGGRFWSEKEISESLGRGVFTPNFESELREYLIPRGIIELSDV